MKFPALEERMIEGLGWRPRVCVGGHPNSRGEEHVRCAINERRADSVSADAVKFERPESIETLFTVFALLKGV